AFEVILDQVAERASPCRGHEGVHALGIVAEIHCPEDNQRRDHGQFAALVDDGELPHWGHHFARAASWRLGRATTTASEPARLAAMREAMRSAASFMESAPACA